MTYEVECPYCETNSEYQEGDDVGAEDEVVVICRECKLKIWIEGDGWKEYRDLHNLKEGCTKPSEGIDWDTVTVSFDGSDSSFDLRGSGGSISGDSNSDDISDDEIDAVEAYMSGSADIISSTYYGSSIYSNGN